MSCNIDNKEDIRNYLAGVRWIWLDLDDTLIDFHANSLIALRLTYDDCRLKRFFNTCDEWVECYMRHNHALWNRYNRAEISQEYLRNHRFIDPLTESSGIDSKKFTKEASDMDVIYLDHLAMQKNMVKDAMKLVDYLRDSSYKIGILSNGFTDVQYRKIHNSGLEGKIDLVVLSDDIGVNKPDQRIYLHAMERAGETNPAYHLMIGDNPDTDIAGAINAGWRAIHFDKSAARLSLTPTGIITPTLEQLIGLRGCLKTNVNARVSSFGADLLLSRRSVLDVHD